MTLADLSAFLFPMRTYLVKAIQTQREDFLLQLAAKDTEIRRLRAELGSRSVRIEPESTDLQKMRRSYSSGSSTQSESTTAYNSGPLDWQGELNRMLQEEEEKTDGLRSE